MKASKTQGIRCVECGCILDHDERCDCESRTAERLEEAKQASIRRTIAHNIEMMEQARKEWEYA